MTVPAIIDCDPGHDDVMAILLGAQTLDLRGITTVHGNASLAQTTRNARQLATLAKLSDIPIAAGMAVPLVRQVQHAPEVHGETGLDGPNMPAPEVPLHDLHAVDFIIEKSKQIDGLWLFPVGPLTNIAVALRRDPELADRIAGISLMGGSLTYGNVTPAAEFNIWCDAEAAHVVFTSGIPIKMVGLNVTRQVAATPAWRKRTREMGTKTAIAVADMLDFYSERLENLFGLEGGSMHDPLAVAAVTHPDMLTFEKMHVSVELRGEHTYGMTLCDWRHFRADAYEVEGAGILRGEEPNVEVAVDVDIDMFWDVFLDALEVYP